MHIIITPENTRMDQFMPLAPWLGDPGKKAKTQAMEVYPSENMFTGTLNTPILNGPHRTFIVPLN